MLPVSRDTLLRTLRRRATQPHDQPTVVGIDDWAWKRGQRYGTLTCDLQRRRIIGLLPDRAPATLDAWLAAHPGIAIVAPDRGGGYGQAVSRVGVTPLGWAHRSLSRKVSPMLRTRPPYAVDRQEGRRQPKPVDPALSAGEHEELVRLRRENRQLKLERDILSRATAWFARETGVLRCGSSGS